MHDLLWDDVAHWFVVDGSPAPLPVRAADIVAEHPGASTGLWIRPAPDLQVNTHFFVVDEIEFDLDRRELQGQDRLDRLCAFVRAVGTAVGKPVEVTSENGPGAPFTTYSPIEDRFS